MSTNTNIPNRKLTPAEKLLMQAIASIAEGDITPEEVVIIIRDKKESTIYTAASSHADIEILGLVNAAQHFLLEQMITPE